MNWYIYWYFTIKYFFWGLLGYGRAGNYIGFLFFYLPFIALIMALIAPLPFVNDNKILIYLSCSVLFIFINEIVFWDETKRLVLNAALVNENIKVVGWDVAITKTGPILVEGNRRPGFDIVQVVSKRGRKDIMYHVENKLNER